MAGNPQIPQGTLNRLRASVTVADAPALNVTAPFTGTDGVSIGFDGAVSTMLPTLTGLVVSPEPYVEVTVVLHLLKTQNLAAVYKARMEANAAIGDVTVRPDSSTLPDYKFVNCSITALRELPMSGKDAGYVVSIRGIYYVNNELWNV